MTTNGENQQPLSTQGDANETEDQLGGTTNLSQEQLKDEGGIADPAEDNPNALDDPDDLHEIKAADSLGEPDLNDYQPDAEDGMPGDDEAEDVDPSANDVDGDGGYTGGANPVETNS